MSSVICDMLFYIPKGKYQSIITHIMPNNNILYFRKTFVYSYYMYTTHNNVERDGKKSVTFILKGRSCHFTYTTL